MRDQGSSKNLSDIYRHRFKRIQIATRLKPPITKMRSGMEIWDFIFRPFAAIRGRGGVLGGPSAPEGVLYPRRDRVSAP